AAAAARPHPRAGRHAARTTAEADRRARRARQDPRPEDRRGDRRARETAQRRAGRPQVPPEESQVRQVAAGFSRPAEAGRYTRDRMGTLFRASARFELKTLADLTPEQREPFRELE